MIPCHYCRESFLANILHTCPAVDAAGWSDGNRIACDFYHRGIVRAAGPEDRYDFKGEMA